MKLIIITAPSGAGKTSITKYLMEQLPMLSFSISAATRQPRGTEKDGVDYYFMGVQEFKEKIKEEAFAEWEMVYEGKYYGTLKSELERIWAARKVPVLDVDVHGAIHVKTQYPDASLSIFVEPPSIDALRQRLIGRGTETPESLETRINKAEFELSFKDHFDAVIMNDDLCAACDKALQVVKGFLDK